MRNSGNFSKIEFTSYIDDVLFKTNRRLAVNEQRSILNDSLRLFHRFPCVGRLENVVNYTQIMMNVRAVAC